MNEGVLSLHVFSNIAAGEAYNREAAMIECIGTYGDGCGFCNHGNIVCYNFFRNSKFD